MQPQKRRQYQPRAARAIQSVIIAQRLAPQRSPREAPIKAGAGERSGAAASSSAPAPSANAPPRDVVRAGDATSTSTDSSSKPLRRAVEVPKQPAEPEIPLPGPHDPINDYTVLPSSGKKVLQSFVFVRVERADVGTVKKMIFGPQMEWKRRYLRVVCMTPGRERLEVYRTERRKGEHPTIRELVYYFPLTSLQFVQQQQLSQEEQLQFERFDYESKKITQEYVYGHIRMVLAFQQGTNPSSQLVMEMCCTSTGERDQWVEFFVAYICKREREELLTYAPPPMMTVQMKLHPQEGVQRFTSSFLAGARPREESAKAKQEEKGFGNMDLSPISTTERTTSALQWDVLIATTVIDRKRCKVECARVGVFTIVNLGEFAVASAEPDASHPDVFYVAPEDPSVAGVLNLYLNDDKMFEVRALHEGKKFRQWLHQCFGMSRDGEMRSFHSPHGQGWSSGRRSGGASGDSYSNNNSFASPVSPRGVSILSDSGGNEGDETEGVPFFQSSMERKKTMHDESLRRVRSVVLQKRKLNSIARKAISEPQSFQWNEMASLAHVEYNIIGSDPLPDSSFTERIVALDAASGRIFVLALPPSSDIVMEFGISDVSCVSGYSEIYGDAGVTFHLFGYGVEVHMVPTREEARKMWTVALRYYWPVDRLLRDRSAEDANRHYLSGGDSANIACVVAASALCVLCGEPKCGTPQCRVSGLQHAEYLEHVAEARTSSGSMLSALPYRLVRCTSDLDDVLARTKAALARAEMACGEEQRLASLPL